MENPFLYTGQVHPPFTEVVTLMTPSGGRARAKKIFGGVIGGGFVGGIVMAGGDHEGIPWLFWTGVGIWVLITLAVTVQAMKSLQSRCPYCSSEIGSSSTLTLNPNDKNEKIECPVCFEWLISHEGTLRAFRPEDIGERKDFDCPVFINARWPNECIVCGAPAVRGLQAKRIKIDLDKLLVGKLSVASGSVSHIPYCAVHQNAVNVDVRNGQLRVLFYDYAARRRYLAVNGVRVPVKK